MAPPAWNADLWSASAGSPKSASVGLRPVDAGATFDSFGVALRCSLLAGHGDRLRRVVRGLRPRADQRSAFQAVSAVFMTCGVRGRPRSQRFPLLTTRCPATDETGQAVRDRPGPRKVLPEHRQSRQDHEYALQDREEEPDDPERQEEESGGDPQHPPGTESPARRFPRRRSGPGFAGGGLPAGPGPRRAAIICARSRGHSGQQPTGRAPRPMFRTTRTPNAVAPERAGHSSRGLMGRIAQRFAPSFLSGRGHPSPNPSPTALRAVHEFRRTASTACQGNTRTAPS